MGNDQSYASIMVATKRCFLQFFWSTNVQESLVPWIMGSSLPFPRDLRIKKIEVHIIMVNHSTGSMTRRSHGTVQKKMIRTL